MKQTLLRLYDWLSTHRRWLWIGVVAVLLPLIGLAVSLRYNEDILDFLPATAEERAAFERLQQQESASQLDRSSKAKRSSNAPMPCTNVPTGYRNCKRTRRTNWSSCIVRCRI